MQTVLIYFSLIITAVGTIPYIVDVIRNKTKPRIVSWAVWCVLTAIAGLASLADQQYPAALLMLVATLETLAVVILGYRHGDRTFEKLDVVCFIGAIVGLLLWWISGSPAVAVIITVVIDLVGAVPSIVHSWKKPYEETWIAFLCSSLGGLATMLATNVWTITAVLYPLYIFVINVIFVVVIVSRRNSIERRSHI